MLLLLACSFDVKLLYVLLDSDQYPQKFPPYEQPCSFQFIVFDDDRQL